MNRIHSLTDEIKSLKSEKTYRSALHISRLMDNNRKLFLEHMENADFNFLLGNFEGLSQAAPKDYNSPGFTRDFEKAFESLLFHLNKIA